MDTDSRHLRKAIQQATANKRGKAIFIKQRPHPHHDRIVVIQVKSSYEEIEDPGTEKNRRKQGMMPRLPRRRVDKSYEIKRWEFEDPYPRCCEFLGIEVGSLPELEVAE